MLEILVYYFEFYWLVVVGSIYNTDFVLLLYLFLTKGCFLDKGMLIKMVYYVFL